MSDQPSALISPIPLENVPILQLRARLKTELSDGNRLGLLTAMSSPNGSQIISLLVQTLSGGVRVLISQLPHDAASYASLTPDIPQAHWFEREINDMWGIRPLGHPRLKSLVIHDTYPDNLFPLAQQVSPALMRKRNNRAAYRFSVVQGNGVYEVPVGPVHAGIIEPGHFRFSCLGEVIENLEIRLGYVHRGVEERLTNCDWKAMRHVVEAASSDTAAANAVAHAQAIESLAGVQAPPDIQRLRSACVEIERAACHIGDLGGICNDLGFGAGSAAFAVLRGTVLGIAEMITGSRFMTGVIVPLSHRNMPAKPLCTAAANRLHECRKQLQSTIPLLLQNSSAIERMEGMGVMKHSLAQDFGLVGPAGRASGIDYDVRKVFRLPEYDCMEWQTPNLYDGDVLARAKVRATEATTALDLASVMLASVTPVSAPESVVELPADSAGVGIVEAWRGELIHLILTNSDGVVARYKIKDPSFNNWTALAVAARGNLLSDFPLCNKSFGLSYSGTDL